MKNLLLGLAVVIVSSLSVPALADDAPKGDGDKMGAKGDKMGDKMGHKKDRMKKDGDGKKEGAGKM